MSEVSSVSALTKRLHKMNDVQIIMAVFKSYCAFNILLLPKMFDNGGWVIGIVGTNVACAVVTMSACKLIQCALALGPRRYNFGMVI